jgi:hypothetical protein
MKFLKSLKLLFKRKTKFKTFSNNEIAVEAFRHEGVTYYHFADSFKVPAARALCALAIYEELRQRCTAEYLRLHIAATKSLLNPSDGKIRLTELALINNNLEERLNLAPFPDHIYKLASVIFFDENESPFSYDFSYNKKKIEQWKKDPEILSFFLTMQFQDLMPFSSMSSERVKNYFNTATMIDQIHQGKLQSVLSKEN